MQSILFGPFQTLKLNALKMILTHKKFQLKTIPEIREKILQTTVKNYQIIS